MISRTIAHYTVGEKLGQGGMGEVYKARDTHLDRLVALKLLPAEKTADPERRQRFVREAKAASALNHPNIVTVYDIGEAGGLSFISMEYVEGQTLDRLIPRKGMRIAEVLRYAVQISDALACAHRAGIIHRDLKPGNVMVTDRGLVKVVDFGLAKLSEADLPAELASTRTVRAEETALTEEGQVVGTIAYMSPEQAEGKPVDGRSDVFSMGCLMYEMLTGRRAFQGQTKLRTLSAVLTQEPPPASQIAEDVPPELERIVSRCLRKEAARRFQHMDDLKVALEELKEESESGKLAAPQRPGTIRRRRLWIVGLAAGLAFASVLVIAWLWWSSKSTGPVAAALTPPVSITTYPGAEERITLSPDGKQVAFSGNVEQRENFDIYVKLIGSEPWLRLTRHPDPDSWPEWSPDGRWIAFTRSENKLLIISPLGGAERVVAEGPLGQSTWSADSQGLIVETFPKPGEARALIAISLATGERKELVRDAGMPKVSHAGNKLAYVSFAGAPRLYVAPLSAQLKMGAPRLIDWVKPTAFIGCAWAEGDRDLVCALRQPARASPALWRIDTERQSPPVIVPFSEDAADPDISLTARRLVFDRFKADANIWRAANPTYNGRSSPAPARFISSTQYDSEPQYSPDGSKIAFLSSRSGQMEIWIAGHDGSEPRMLTSLGSVGGPHWSPDGKSVMFARAGEVYTVDSLGGAPKRIACEPALKAFWLTYSHDGQWIYLLREDRPGIWRMPAGGGAAVQITANHAARPIESADGRFLFYARNEGAETSLWRMPSRGGPEQKIVGFARSAGYPRMVQFALARRGLYCIPYDHPDRPAGIDLVDLRTGAIKHVLTVDMPQRFNAGGFSVSPDERWLLYVLYDFEDDIMQFENFR